MGCGASGIKGDVGGRRPSAPLRESLPPGWAYERERLRRILGRSTKEDQEMGGGTQRGGGETTTEPVSAPAPLVSHSASHERALEFALLFGGGVPTAFASAGADLPTAPPGFKPVVVDKRSRNNDHNDSLSAALAVAQNEDVGAVAASPSPMRQGHPGHTHASSLSSPSHLHLSPMPVPSPFTHISGPSPTRVGGGAMGGAMGAAMGGVKGAGAAGNARFFVPRNGSRASGGLSVPPRVLTAPFEAHSDPPHVVLAPRGLSMALRSLGMNDDPGTVALVAGRRSAGGIDLEAWISFVTDPDLNPALEPSARIASGLAGPLRDYVISTAAGVSRRGGSVGSSGGGGVGGGGFATPRTVEMYYATAVLMGARAIEIEVSPGCLVVPDASRCPGPPAPIAEVLTAVADAAYSSRTGITGDRGGRGRKQRRRSSDDDDEMNGRGAGAFSIREDMPVPIILLLDATALAGLPGDQDTLAAAVQSVFGGRLCKEFDPDTSTVQSLAGRVLVALTFDTPQQQQQQQPSKRLASIAALRVSGGISPKPATGVHRISERDVMSSALSRQETALLCDASASGLVLAVPVGGTQDSSASWSLGVQLSAVDFYAGRDLWPHQGFMSANGYCGFVPRPRFQASVPGKLAGTTLAVRVIAAQGLREVASDDAGGPEAMVDAYAVIAVEGHDADRATRRTDTVRDVMPGGYFLLDETFTFRLSFPDQAIITIFVADRDDASADDMLGYAALPVCKLREGARAISLRDQAGYVIEGCSITCQFSFRGGSEAVTR